MLPLLLFLVRLLLLPLLLWSLALNSLRLLLRLLLLTPLPRLRLRLPALVRRLRIAPLKSSPQKRAKPLTLA